MDVGHHLGRLGGDERVELGADVGGRPFERRKAGELLAIVEFGLGKAGIVKVRRLLMIVAGAARPVGDEALGAGPGGGAQSRGQGRRQSLLETLAMIVAALARMVDRRPHRRRDLFARRKLGERVAELLARIRVAQPVEDHRARQQRREIERRQGERAVDRRQRAL